MECSINIDGVQESKSGGYSIDCYCIKVKNCQTIYPLKLIKPEKKFKCNDQQEIKKTLNELSALSNITNAIFDNPKRSIARCALNHASTYACEYCESPATHVTLNSMEVKRTQLKRENIINTIEFLKSIPGNSATKIRDTARITALQSLLNDLNACTKKRHLVWPETTKNGPPRTQHEIELLTSRLPDPGLGKEEKKGFYAASHFLTLPNFHFIDNIPAEYMHSVCQGVIKRLLELTFKVGENRERRITRVLSDPSCYNECIRNVRVPREFSRRCRTLDLGVMKAQEYRNVILFFTPIIIKCIPQIYKKEIQLWLHLWFMIRACTLPNDEFEQVNDNAIEESCHQFYKMYEEMYGPKNCTYSIHVVASHLLKIRGQVPLTERLSLIHI